MSDPCRDVLERLVEAATGSMPPHDRAGLVEHLAVCDRCREEAARIEATVGHLRAAGQFAVPPGFWAEFTDRLTRRLAVEREPGVARLRRWLASPRHAWGTAAVTAAAVLAITAAVRFGPTPATPDPVRSRARALVTETMTTTLPSLGEMLETWRAGLTPDGDAASDRAKP
jgi:anti-sigma factor RsiW